MTAEWVLNENPDGIDILHPDPREECNSEHHSIKGRSVVDAETADALIQLGQARLCGHCGSRAARTATATAGGPVYTERPTLDTRGPDDR